MKKLHIIVYIIAVILFSCDRVEVSSVEKIVIDEEFINSKIAGYDSIILKELGNGIGTSYLLDDDITIYVWRDSLNRIRAWFKDKNDIRIEGSEVFETTGQIMGKIIYNDGKIDGKAIYYFDDGRISSVGYFKNNRKHGEWKEYDKNGNITSVTIYDD